MAEQSYLEVAHLTREELARFFSKVQHDPATGCWNWTAAKIIGYGTFWLHGRNEACHRIMFAWLVERLPRGLRKGVPVLDHIACDNPSCCNPAHLRLVPNVENLARTGSVSAINRKKTHCVNGHALPEHPNRYDGYGRTCVLCNNKRQREKKRAQALAARIAKQHGGAPPQTQHPSPSAT